MGIPRAKCIVDACILKAVTPVGARRRSTQPLCSHGVCSADFKQDIRKDFPVPAIP